MLNLILLSTGIDRTQEVVNRLTAFLQSTRTLSVEFKIRPFGETKWGSGRLAFERPRRTRFDLKIPGVDYSFSATEKGTLEIERSIKKYEESGPALMLSYPPSTFARANEFAFPLILTQLDPRRALPSGTALKWTDQELIDGQPTDHLVSSWQGGSREAHIFVGKAGRPAKFELRVIKGNQTSSAETVFSKYRVNAPIPASTFAIPLPLGYVPRSLPLHAPSPEPGEKLDLREWVSRRASGILADAIKGKTFLFVTAKECKPSDAIRPNLKQIAEDLKVPVIELALDRGLKSKGFPLYEASSDLVWSRMGIAGTPMIYIVDKNARMSRAWYGYDPSQKERLRAYLKAALDELR